MKLVKCILIVQLSCFCQALRNTSTQTDPTPVQTRAEEQEFNSDPYIHKLSGKCNFTLRLPGNKSSEAVALTANYTDLLVEQICQNLDCGSVYHVNKTSSPSNTSCFHDCLLQDGRLQNCSQSVGTNCTVIAGAVCGHQLVRLAGGTDRCTGRVELWSDGSWGSVCDDQWDVTDADVACAQLGCGYAVNVTGQGGPFPPGRGPVYRDELNCTGREDNLWDCPTSTQDQSDCGHKEDAGVVCSEMRAVRLTGGLDRCSGKVEIHRNGTWGSVCDNCWNRDMASRVCSMLGCGAEPLNYTRFLPPLTHNNGTLWYYNCPPAMHSLWQCKEYANKKHLCQDSKASGVVCNGSLGFPVVTTANTSDAPAVWTTGAPTVRPVERISLATTAFLSSIAVCLLLLVIVVMNTVLCCYYRRRHAFLLLQTRSGSRAFSENQNNSHHDAVNLINVTANSPHTDVPSNPRYHWRQFSSVDSASVDTDYEHYEPSNEPSVPLSTFRNSQRLRTDVKPLMKPAGLDRLCEEIPEPREEVMGVFMSCHDDATAAQYARVSKISIDSFDSSSTSSGECYENTNGYVEVTPEPGLDQPSTVDPLKLVCSNNQLHSKHTTTNLHSTDDENEGPIYSPVGPEENSSSEDDYDDVGCLV